MHNHFISGFLGCILFLFSYSLYSFTLYDNLGYKGKPDLAPFGLKKIHIIYQNSFWPSTDSLQEQPNEAITRQCAQNAFGLSDDDLVVIDIEHWPYDKRYHAVDTVVASITKLKQVTDWLKDEMPGLKFGHYDVIPIRDYWTPVQNKSAAMAFWQSADSLLAPVAEAVDAAFPSLYTFYNDSSGWKIYAAGNISEARRVAPGKPVYPYIWPQYHEGGDPVLRLSFIDSAYWACQLNALYSLGVEGAVFWSGGNDWDTTQGWWQATKAFIQSRGLPSLSRPTLDAGENQMLPLGHLNASLSATITDTKPISNPSIQWDGVAVFSNPQDLETNVSFAKPGNYRLRVTAKNGGLISLDSMRITVPGWEPYARYALDGIYSGKVIDSSGNGFDGINRQAFPAAGKFGTALQFSAAESSVVPIPDVNAFNMANADFSVSAWTFLDTITPHMYAASKGPVGACCASNGYPGYLLGVYNYKLAFRIEDEAAGINSIHASANMTLPCSTWIHMAGIRHGDRIFLYINGQPVDSETIPLPELYSVNNGYPVSLGHRLSGKLDEVQIYNRALTSQEVLNLYEGNHMPEISASPFQGRSSLRAESVSRNGSVLRLRMQGSGKSDLRVDVFSLSGQKALQWRYAKAFSGVYDIPLPPAIRDGCYVARIKTESGQKVFKLTLIRP